MNCRIEAWLEQGKPCIRITDADSGRVCVQWSPQDDGPPADTLESCDCGTCPAGAALHGLVRELFLLACMDRVSRQKGQTLLKSGLHGKLGRHTLKGAESFEIAFQMER